MTKQLSFIVAVLFLLGVKPAFSQSLVQHEVQLKGIPGVTAGNFRRTADKGFIITGTYGSDPNGNYARPVLIKTDSLFQVEWQHLLYQSDNGVFPIAYGVDVMPAGDDSYVVLGTVNRNLIFNANYVQGQHDIFLTKVKSDGTILWTRHYGRGLYNNDAFSYHDVPYSLEADASPGGFLISGYSSDNNNPHPFYLRTDAMGLVDTANSTFSKRMQTSCNTIIMLGTRGSYRREMISLKNSGGDLFLAVACGDFAFLTRMKPSGAIVWQKSIPVTAGIGDDLPEPFNLIFGAGYESFINNIEELPNGDIAIAGTTFGFAGAANPDGSWGIYNPVGFVATITPNGDYLKGTFFYHPTGNGSGQTADLFITDMKVLPNGNFLFTGNINIYNSNAYQVFLLEYALDDQTLQIQSPNKVKMHVFGNHSVNTVPYGLDLPKLAFEADGDPVVLYDDMKIRVFDNYFNTLSTSTPGCSADAQIISTGLNFDPVNTTIAWVPVQSGTLTGWNVNTLNAYDTVTLVCNGFLTGIPDANTLNVRLLPNPNNGTFALEIPEASTNNPTMMEVFSVTGQSLYQTTLYEKNQSIMLQNINDGMYFIRLSNNKHSTMLKWIKKE